MDDITVTETPKKRRRVYKKHGLWRMKQALMRLGGRAVDRRFTVGKELAKWRSDIARDLGGNLSTQENAVLDICVRGKLILDSLDSWLLSQDTLINKKKRAVILAVKDRQAVARDLVENLKTLGLKKVVRTLSLEEILAQDDQDSSQNAPPNAQNLDFTGSTRTDEH